MWRLLDNMWCIALSSPCGTSPSGFYVYLLTRSSAKKELVSLARYHQRKNVTRHRAQSGSLRCRFVPYAYFANIAVHMKRRQFLTQFQDRICNASRCRTFFFYWGTLQDQDLRALNVGASARKKETNARKTRTLNAFFPPLRANICPVYIWKEYAPYFVRFFKNR